MRWLAGVLLVACADPTVTEERQPIFHGTPSAPAAYPWAGRVYRDGTPSCSAVLIDATHALTAAHCVLILRETRYNLEVSPVAAARLTLSVHADDGGANLRHPLRDIAIHPAYAPYSNLNDVAVLTLRAPVQLASYATPASATTLAALATQAPQPGRALGYGKTHIVDDDRSRGLHQVDLTIDGPARCRSEGLAGDATSLCALPTLEFTSACVGDSGGPLLVGGELVGLTSTVSDPCGLFSTFVHVGLMQAWMQACGQGSCARYAPANVCLPSALDCQPDAAHACDTRMSKRNCGACGVTCLGRQQCQRQPDDTYRCTGALPAPR